MRLDENGLSTTLVDEGGVGAVASVDEAMVNVTVRIDERLLSGSSATNPNWYELPLRSAVAV